MTFSGHLAVTSVVLTVTDNPVVVLPVVLGLHFLTDAIPHAEWPPFKKASLTARWLIFLDAVATVALVWLLYVRLPYNPWLITVVIIAGLLPDLTDSLAHRFSPRMVYFHDYFHSWPQKPIQPIQWGATVTGRVPTVVKVAVQAGIVLSGLLILLTLP